MSNMTDRYQAIRDALASFPAGWGEALTQIRKSDIDGIVEIGANDEDGRFFELLCIDTDRYGYSDEAMLIAELIVSCNPDTIRALLEERDALRKEVDDAIATLERLKQ